MRKGSSSTFPPVDPLSFMDQAPAAPVIAHQSAASNDVLAAMDSDAAAFFSGLEADPDAGLGADPSASTPVQAVVSAVAPGRAGRPFFAGARRPGFTGSDAGAPKGERQATVAEDRADGDGPPSDEAQPSETRVNVVPDVQVAKPAPFATSGKRPSFGSRPRFASSPEVPASEPEGRNSQPTLVKAVDGVFPPHEDAGKEKEVFGQADQAVSPPEFPISAVRGRPRFAQRDVDQETPKSYVEPPKGKFAQFNSQPSREVKALRADIKAASIVTELVTAMALHPGSGAETVIKQKALTSILALSRRAADDLIARIDPDRADVGWVKAQALSMTSRMLAKQWGAAATGVSFDVVRERFEEDLQIVNALLEDESGEVSLCMEAFASGDYYKKVDSAQSATDHRIVSIHLASWDFAEAVGSVRHKEGGVFSFGMEAELVVHSLLQKTFEIVSACRPEISDSEAAIAYWRGAMRRATQLIGAEYRAKSVETVKWVDDAPSDKRVARLAECPQIFERQAVPFIFEWGMKNFQSIERASKKLIEEASDVQKTSDRQGR